MRERSKDQSTKLYEVVTGTHTVLLKSTVDRRRNSVRTGMPFLSAQARSAHMRVYTHSNAHPYAKIACLFCMLGYLIVLGASRVRSQVAPQDPLETE